MRLAGTVVLAAFALVTLSGCQVAGGSSGGSAVVQEQGTGLDLPGDVSQGHRRVYLLTDVSCDMASSLDKANRTRALLVAANAAVMDSGTLVAGVVRALVTQKIIWQTRDFSHQHRAHTARFRVQDAVTLRDDTVAGLRKFVNRPAGGTHNGCASDLVTAVGQVRLNADQAGVPAGSRTDLVYVTNGLIVDRKAKIVMTQASLTTQRQYRALLKRVEAFYPKPDLKGITVWLVGTGWASSISNDQTGDLVRKLWTTYLERAGAHVHIVQGGSDLNSLLPS